MLWGKHYFNRTYLSGHVEHYRYALRRAPTPPWGVPCSGYSGLIPFFRDRNIPILVPFGAMSFSIIVEWLILSKHFSMSSSNTRLSIPWALELRFKNSIFCASCAERPGLNP
jgi:hypothetical protein